MNERQLIIMRHAHAQAAAGLGGSDHARELTPAGQLAARGKREIVMALHPQLVLCSTSTRTTQTCEALDLDVPVELHDDLYRGGSDDYRHIVSALDDSITRALLIAHQPSVEQFAIWLAGRAAAIGHFRPATVAVVEVEVPWAALDAGDGALLDFHG